MDYLFIEKSDLIRLDIFKYILFSKQNITINQIKKEFQLSQATVYRYISQLHLDIESCFNSEYDLHLELKHDNSYKIIYNSTRNINFYVNELRLFYIKKNTKFKILTSLMNRKYKNIEQLSNELHLSKSTVYKKLRSLTDLTQEFGITISCNKNGDNIRGLEKDIRLFYFLILWESRSTLIDTNIDSNTSPYISGYNFKVDFSLSQNKKLNLIQEITIRRIIEHKMINISSDFINDTYLLVIPTLEFHSYFLTKESIHDEKIFFSYIIRFLIPEMNTFSEKNQIVHNYSKEIFGQKISLFLKKFVNTFKISFSKKNYVELFFILIIYTVYFKYFDYDILKFYINDNWDSEHYSSKNDVSTLKNITNFLAIESKELGIDFSHLSISSKNILEQTLFFFYASETEKKTITIYVSYSKNLYIIPIIKNFISSIFGNNVEFTHNIDLANIVISDTFEGNLKNKNYFYFTNEHSASTWNNLSEYINYFISQSTLLEI
ncbi:helix-turn-helix domain-containing protein [Enterococcus sp. MSG3310]|uniref:helix-turn-helix domain-containing protein n=1 Tax=Enterococcus sp. MSG3310 TaxID=2774835 RepID=UPI003D2FCD14